MTKNIFITMPRAGFALAALVLGLHSSCTKNFEEYNTNPHEATEDMMTRDNLKTGAFFTQMQRNVVLFKDGSNADSDYQVAQGLTSDLYSGYLAPTGSWYGGVHNGTYYFITNWLETTFRSGFSSIMPAWQAIVQNAEEQNLPEVAALATIVKVQGMHRLADTYGPIPYINYGSGNLANEYDALADVYSKFFEELNQSISVLTNFAQANPNTNLLATYDLIYGGNVQKWIKFANTLRLRLALRVAYADPAKAKAEAEAAAANPFGFVAQSSEKTSLKHSSNLVYYHPLFEIAYNFNAGEVRMGATMDAYMNGYQDPRRARYFRPANDGNYHGVRQGIVTSVWAPYVSPRISNLNVDNGTTEIVWMTAAESHFLRAEAALRGWNVGGGAKSFYESGIAASFEENSVTGAAGYASNSTLQPIAFTDFAEGSAYHAPSPSTVTIAWSDTESFERNLERVITQKWLAMYPDGPEGWAEFRRTGYPRLIPVVVNNSPSINRDVQVRRIPYPQSEYNNNRAGVLSGVAKLQGQDNGGTKLWWDKK
ncbi:SusD/RagB family nutrient-binding outer membrane lipoprotein [Sphingobacterium sp. lm-10]|uniref:SusD/RagB family nutrient-binding outer membrane lipoprotein n=1 Tax=Sphingobacterium sp. lm-10 TaxID=2944904 RepID=UPI00201FD051|nr:SusD/RagB family nutrient-binding outer membrane lipoprotein [Sphingobacterium sp. lm-10]MCL7988665.1 SusD/RagB family nutrient-binding outer membrane lipoprotein [Sphingobacterium sp. lm-10]